MKTIGMVMFNNMTQLDLTGPLEVFSRFPEIKIYLLSKTLEPVQCDRGLRIVPDSTFETCPANFDVLFVPGGPGVSALLNDDEYLNFIKSKGDSTYITSVCTGSIVLAACGLLDGYKATTHWLSIELLKRFKVVTVDDRVVVDRNRITGAGVTSGIDFSLMLSAILFGDQRAKEVQLLIEYNPQPPFQSGHPSFAEQSIVSNVIKQREEIQKNRIKEIDNFIANHNIGR